MVIEFTKVSDSEHAVSVVRSDQSIESKTLTSRSFLLHDLAHFAVEVEIPLLSGFWGCVASGAELSGVDYSGSDIELAESLAGPVQTLMKREAPVEDYVVVFDRGLEPGSPDTPRLAAAIHERIRQLRGLWRATNYGASMELLWPHPTSHR